MTSRTLLGACLLLAACLLCTASANAQRADPAAVSSMSLASVAGFAPRHSFAAPFIFPGKGVIPHWEIGAGAVVDETCVRLTPARQSRTGFAWNTVPVTFTDWEVLLEFKVTGRRDFGGDGFGLWLVERPELVGTVYGATDYWNGLLVAFDSFNNDGVGLSPLISAITNDGTQKFDAGSDGATQALESCSADFRNIATPTLARLRYLNRVLSLEIATRREVGPEAAPIWVNCFSVSNLELGIDKYFGVTAHTGDVADAHEIRRFEVVDLTPPATDLEAVRAKYAEGVQKQQRAHDHGHTLNGEEFQRIALTMLQQIQGEVNLLETGQIELRTFLESARDASEPGAPAAAGSVSAGSLTRLEQGQSSILNELQSLKSALSSPSSSGTAPRIAAASGAVDISAQGLVGVANAVDPLLQSQNEAFAAQLATLTALVKSNAAAHTAQVEQLTATIGRLHRDVSQLATANGVNRDDSPAAGGVGGFTFACVLFTAIGVLGLGIHAMQQQRASSKWRLA